MDVGVTVFRRVDKASVVLLVARNEYDSGVEVHRLLLVICQCPCDIDAGHTFATDRILVGCRHECATLDNGLDSL